MPEPTSLYPDAKKFVHIVSCRQEKCKTNLPNFVAYATSS